jgi:hypothetical protein
VDNIETANAADICMSGCQETPIMKNGDIYYYKIEPNKKINTSSVILY